MKTVALLGGGILVGMVIADVITRGEIHTIVIENVSGCIHNIPSPPASPAT